MELTKTNREGLLRELNVAKEQANRARKLLNQSETAEDLKGLFEIDIFLADERIKLIEQSLIDNEIDF